jgi:triacylglycerol lipase
MVNDPAPAAAPTPDARTTSSLARLQQGISLGLALVALLWLAWHWQRAPALALAGVLAILLAHALVLGIEFIVLFVLSRDGSALQPTAAELLRAWFGECLSAPRIFYGRQPFAWRCLPDATSGAALQGRRGVVLVHGFVCNRGFWTPWLRALQADGRAFVAVNLEPLFGSIEGHAAAIDLAVARVQAATGLAPLLVGHSMGGLALRHWLRGAGAARAAHLVTIGTPHGGTWIARFSPSPNARQMRLASSWLRALEADPASRSVAATCWYSNCDNIVLPAKSATFAGADNRLLRGHAHVDLAFAPEVLAHALAWLRQHDGAMPPCGTFMVNMLQAQ